VLWLLFWARGLVRIRTLACGALNNILDDFENFLTIDLQLRPRTVYRHKLEIRRYLRLTNHNPQSVSRNDVRQYLMRFKDAPSNTYANVLKSLKVFYRDYLEMPYVVNSFRFPRKVFVPKVIPPKEALIKFYNELDTPVAKAMFLMYATTGLRRNEVLRLKLDNVYLDKRMITPHVTNSSTKHTWITFYNDEAEELLNIHLSNHVDERIFPVTEVFFRRRYSRINEKIGAYISPQTLREWFCQQMGELGVPDRYIDAFCGRVPKSILARHYTDYSPERLKRIYDRANLKVLS
jgi:integrase